MSKRMAETSLSEPGPKRRAIPSLHKGPDAAGNTIPLSSFEAIANEYSQRQERRDKVFQGLQGVQRSLDRAVLCMHRGESEASQDIISSAEEKLQAAIAHTATEEDRVGALAGSVEAYVKARSMAYFFATGTLLRRADVPFAKRQEYLQGIMGFLSELQRYATLRAIDKDNTSLEVCKGLVDACNAELMQFDWKNGPLRQRYDGIKYVLRKLEDTLFELSLQTEEASGGAAKEDMKEDEPAVIDTEEFQVMRQEMEEYDDMRESVIKQCRDMQKNSKNSIYNLHRGDLKKAVAQLESVKKQADVLLPQIEQFSGGGNLRQGSFSNALEEYAEGFLFLLFLQEGRVATLEECAPCNSAEYLGGILDLTGEIGRYAVKEATQRNAPAVRKCQAVVDGLLGEVSVLGGLPGGVSKKIDQCKQTLRKLENVLYELSLSRKSVAVMDEEPPSTKEGGE